MELSRLTCIVQRVIKDTFALNEVPREALFIGMAGLLPYVATSLSTVYLAWDINHATADGQGFLISGETAELMLHIIEPLQMGYGAVVSCSILAFKIYPKLIALRRSSHSLELSIGV